MKSKKAKSSTTHEYSNTKNGFNRQLAILSQTFQGKEKLSIELVPIVVMGIAIDEHDHIKSLDYSGNVTQPTRKTETNQSSNRIYLDAKKKWGKPKKGKVRERCDTATIVSKADTDRKIGRLKIAIKISC